MAARKEPVVTVITAEEIHTFIRRAREELRAVDEAGPFASLKNPELGEREEAAALMLVFCAEAAGWTRSPSLLPFLASILGGGRDDDDNTDSDAYRYTTRLVRHKRLASSVAEILAAAPAPVHQLAKLAQSPDQDVRCVVAKHLPLDHDASVRILETLAMTDESERVRERARDRLAAVRDIAWWQGKFSRDPLGGLGQAEAERLRAPLETIAQVLDGSAWERRQRVPELAAAIAELPTPAALDVLRITLSNAKEPDAIEPVLLAQLVTRDRDGSVLASLVERWTGRMEKRHYLFDAVAKARPLADATARRTAASRLFDDARRRSERDPADPAAELAATVMGALWPAEDDPTPVLLAMLAQHERCGESRDELSNAYWKLLDRRDIDVSPLFLRLAGAHLLNYPAPWPNAPGWWHTLLDRAATLPQLRHLVARVLEEATDPKALGWALSRQIGRAHDPANDPAPAEILRRAWGNPLRRAALLAGHDLVRRALPLAREDLRAARLTYLEAGTLLEAIDDLWGGLILLRYTFHHTPERDERHLEDRRREYESFLGPEAFCGPPTEAEWAIFRALRDQALASIPDSRDWFWALRVLPSGEWTAGDRAMLLRAMEVTRHEDSHFARSLASALITHPDEAWLPLMDELAGTADEDGSLTARRDQMREALAAQDTTGPKPPANPTAPGGRAAPPAEWMDEPDDEP